MNEFEIFLKQKSENLGKIHRFRAFSLYHKYKKELALKPIIHILGTNGKGSTGRFLAQLLALLSYKVGHFTSPHLLSFNERFYKNGNIISDEELEKAHQCLKNIMKKDLEKLSYFEYCTFLCPFLFKDCDFVILEAGMGGEYDSTSLFEKRLSVFTQIGFDHMPFLGEDLEQIARTKFKAISAQTLSSSKQEAQILKLGRKIALLRDLEFYESESLLNESLKKQSKLYIQKFKLAPFLEHNLNLALAALKLLIKNDEKILQALLHLNTLDLRARCECLSENLYIDVGHNEMAARALLEIFKGKKIILIYNSFLDKDIFTILRILKPIIAKIMVYKYQSHRALATEYIFDIAKKLALKCEEFQGIKSKKLHLVFGSFVLVEHFLKENFETA